MRGPHARFCERKNLRKLFLRFTYSINTFLGIKNNKLSIKQKNKREAKK